jgi:hypothetical protein
MPQYAIDPIFLDHQSITYVTQPQLVAANDESIRLGFSRTLKNIGRLASHLKFPILEAIHHTPGEGLRNIRLSLQVGPHADDLHYIYLDVTPDNWATIQGNPAVLAE